MKLLKSLHPPPSEDITQKSIITVPKNTDSKNDSEISDIKKN